MIKASDCEKAVTDVLWTIVDDNELMTMTINVLKIDIKLRHSVTLSYTFNQKIKIMCVHVMEAGRMQIVYTPLYNVQYGTRATAIAWHLPENITKSICHLLFFLLFVCMVTYSSILFT